MPDTETSTTLALAPPEDEQKQPAVENAARARKSHGPGHGGPANGEGWGGPAKGASDKGQRPAFVGTPGPGRGKFSVAGEAKKEQTYRRVETLMQLLWDIANNEKEVTASRINAAQHLLNRIQGLPVQTVLTSTTDDLSMMTDDELAADIEGRSRKVRAFREAVMGADMPSKSDGVGDRGTVADEPDSGAPPPADSLAS